MAMYSLTFFFDGPNNNSNLYCMFVEANRPKEAIRSVLKSKDWTSSINDENLISYLDAIDDRGDQMTDEDADRLLHALVSEPGRRLRIFVYELTNPLEIKYRPSDIAIDDGTPGFIDIEDITSLIDLYQFDDTNEEDEGPMSLSECFAAMEQRYAL